MNKKLVIAVRAALFPLVLASAGVGASSALGQTTFSTQSGNDVIAAYIYTPSLNFLYGFNSGSGNYNPQGNGRSPWTGVTDVTPSITLVPQSTSTWLITYNASAASLTGGATATASLSMEWGPTPGGLGLGFFNIDMSVSQSNPNGIAVTPAIFQFQDTELAYTVSEKYAYGVNTIDYIGLNATGNVGGNTGDFVAAGAGFDGVGELGSPFSVGSEDVNAADTSLNSVANFPLNEQIPDVLSEFGSADFQSGMHPSITVEAQDPGGTAGVTVSGSASSAQIAVPEPASLGLLTIGGLSLFGRRRR